MKLKQNFAVVNVNTNQLPIITEDTKTRYTWVPFGVYGHDDFFDAVRSAFNISTTTSACVEGIADLIFGKGLYSKTQTFNDTLQKLIPQEETKRVSFDLKLFGNAAYQVYWNDDHTKIIKFYHVPIQTLRAEKLYGEPKVQNYYYCTDWNDQRKIKDKKKVPAFGTSNEKMEILYIKSYFPGLYYYSLPDWVSAMTLAISGSEGSGFFRWFDSGDIQSLAHLKQIAQIANNLPGIQFWLPTKEYKIVSDFTKENELPENLTIRISGYMIDGPAPVALSKKIGVLTSTVSKTSWTCPAGNQGNKCLSCRACWDKTVPNVTYKYH